ncbi:MAG: 16S rRNA (cytosine(1402)-N(4))-methyltransferase RsmH [Bacteroidales bacterium]|nr:16S rRNA (cytosine(1402)-N(4))-methyltransferase RsmH [Bacteroidales bacterium]
MTNEYHKSVMLAEAVEGLAIRPEGTYVDVTFGGGGHSRAILSALGPEGRLYAFDQDEDARANAIDDPRFTLIGENFSHLKAFLRLHGVRRVDGVLADLGVSSHQFDVAERGFSTRFDGALDLRMDRRSPVTGADLVNNSSEEDLARLLRLYGELPNARQMARAIVKYRECKGVQGSAGESGIKTTSDLKEAVAKHLPRGMENKYLAMLFQALRIEVNGELEALKAMLQQASELLVEGGHLVVISYHSLEDRLVKNYMRSGNFEGVVEKDFYGNPLSPMRMVCKCTATDEEVAENNRARSAMLRVAEKVEMKNEK